MALVSPQSKSQHCLRTTFALLTYKIVLSSLSAESGKTPFFISLANQGSLTSNLFAFWLAPDGAAGSELSFGAVDSSKYTGSQSYWFHSHFYIQGALLTLPIILGISYHDLDALATEGTQYYWNTPVCLLRILSQFSISDCYHVVELRLRIQRRYHWLIQRHHRLRHHSHLRSYRRCGGSVR